MAWGPRDGKFTTGQLLGGIGSRALNVVFPGLGTLANVAGNAYHGGGPLAGLFNRPQQLTRQPLDFQAGVTPNLAPMQMGGPSNLMSGFTPSPYGPYAGGYQLPNPLQAPSNINPISGLPNTQTGYGVSLPNYGGMQQPTNMPNVFANASRGSGGPFQSTFTNDPWGETAAGFGIGIGAPGQIQQLNLPAVLGRDRSA